MAVAAARRASSAESKVAQNLMMPFRIATDQDCRALIAERRHEAGQAISDGSNDNSDGTQPKRISVHADH